MCIRDSSKSEAEEHATEGHATTTTATTTTATTTTTTTTTTSPISSIWPGRRDRVPVRRLKLGDLVCIMQLEAKIYPGYPLLSGLPRINDAVSPHARTSMDAN